MPTAETDGPVRRIAFATFGGQPGMAPDDGWAHRALEARYAIEAVAVPWSAAGVDWSRFDAVVVRSTWDYHRRPAEFESWARWVEAVGATLWNPAAVVRWNSDKKYLRDLEREGVKVVPTEWIGRGEARDLGAVLASRGWDRAVVKPAVSATAYRTWLVDARDAHIHQSGVNTLLEDADALVQPFLAEVQRDGEWSFVFFAGMDGSLAFSHAVLKRPARGDFRVQDEFGGTHSRVAPPARLLREVEEVARAVARAAPAPLLYARLDGVVTKGAGVGGVVDSRGGVPDTFDGVSKKSVDALAGPGHIPTEPRRTSNVVAGVPVGLGGASEELAASDGSDCTVNEHSEAGNGDWRFLLMEAELIEPTLFLGDAEGGSRFAAAIAGRMASADAAG